MDKTKYPRRLFTVLGLIALFLPGCWNYRELNQLSLVAGVGIDSGKKPGTLQLTVQIIKPGGIAQKGGGTSGQTEPFIVKTATGKTVLDAVKNLLLETDRRLYWPHTQIMIFGKDQAVQGVNLLVDYFLRTNQPRPTIWILVAEGKAADVLKTPGQQEIVSALEISQLIQIQVSTSKMVAINLQDFTGRLLSKTTAPIATMIKVNETGKKRFGLSGTAVFKNGRMVGQLDGTQTRGLMWVQGKVRYGGINVSAPGGSVGVEIRRVRSQVKPFLAMGKLKMKIRIQEAGTLECQMSPKELNRPEMLEVLSRRTATAIRNEIYAALAKARELNADIFGFGDAINKAYPKQWQQIKGKWDQIFPQITVEVDVRANINQVGLTVLPPVPLPE